MPTLILLLGEQPVPNLLPTLYLKPSRVLLVYTDRTREVRERLEPLLGVSRIEAVEVPAYDFAAILQTLRTAVDRMGAHGDLIVNATGGTKIMSLAAHELAREAGAELVYFRTEGGVSWLYRYALDNGRLRQKGDPEEIPTTLNLDQYLRVHIGEYTPLDKKMDRFERLVGDILEQNVDELKRQITKENAWEVDLVIRCGNQVGIAEVKSGKKATKREGIDQLTTAGGREYLGTYTRKFLIVDRRWSPRSPLHEVLKAYRIQLIELPSYGAHGQLSEEDRRKLIETVRRALLGSRS